MKDRRALVAGVANERSIAWGIASALYREGAQLVLTCQNERLLSRVQRLAARLGNARVMLCDFTDDAQVEAMARQLQEDWERLDVLVHSIAYSPRELLVGDYLDNLERDAFLQAMDISVYSFAALARTMMAVPLMDRGGALLTLSYLGAERAVPNYNVMGVAKAALESSVRYMAADLGPRGIRVNALSPGPIRTLAASGISGLHDILNHVENLAPLRRNVTLEDIGNAAAFLCSEHAAAITGQVLYVDCGYSTVVPVPSMQQST